MIVRIWHGWTEPRQANEYERLLLEEIFPEIAAKEVPGYRGIELLRRDAGEEVEFLTLMRFDSTEAVRDFAGTDYEEAYVPESAQAVLKRYDGRSQHYDLVHGEDSSGGAHGRV